MGAVWGINKINRAKALEAREHLKEQEQLYLRTVETLALAVDAKDQTTYGHIRRVKAYALGLARLSGITDPSEMKAIETGSLLHDIGKLAIEDYILNKPGRLSKREFEKMKVHATAGDEILQQVQFPYPVAEYVRHHHERWDGKGYPDGLKGDQIPIGSRILSISDAFDAIRSSRPYKAPFGLDDSVVLLRAQAGTAYDPELVELFVRHVHELEESANEAARNISELSFRKYFESIDQSGDRLDPAAQLPSPPSMAEELIMLYEFCGGVGRCLSLGDSLPILARRLRRLVPYDTCAIYLYQEDDSVQAEYVCGDMADAIKGKRIGLGKGISGWVAAYKKTMINTEPHLEFQDKAADSRFLQDALVVPLLQGDDCIGTISLFSRSPKFFTPGHLSILEMIAQQAAPLVREAAYRSDPESSDRLDPVTGTHRFSYLATAGAQVLDHARQVASPLSLVLLEVRNHSQTIALFGTWAGDEILRRVAHILRSELRQTDILVRYGHQGFIALLPGVKGSQALRYAQRLQHKIRSSPVTLAPGHASYVSCTAGIASYPDDGSMLLALLQAAHREVAEYARLSQPPVSGTEGNILEFPPRI